MGNLTQISDGNPHISVSGTPLFSDEIRWPFGSGVDVLGNVGFSEPLDACMIDFNAQFGFNQQAHRFTMTWAVKCPDFNDIVNSLPPIGDEVFFNIGPSEFLIRGRLVHTDITKSSRGFIVTTTVEDFRPDLSRISIDTYGLYDVNEEPDANVVDVHHWFLTTQDGQDNPRQLRMLRENGATYRQIFDAINNQNPFLGSRIPDPGVLQQNLPEDVDSYRFTFRTTPALDALVKIFTDVSFDLYWNMGEDRLNVINRKEQIDLSLNQIPFKEDPDNPVTASLKFGMDDGERPTSVQILGDRMEGVLSNGGQLKSTGGTYDASVQLDLSESAIWIPGWPNATIFYFGEDGTLKEDNPTDAELSAALKGIEFWTLIKNQSSSQHLESRLAVQSIDFRDGIQYSVIRPASPSGVGLVPNRGQEGRNWIIEWYNKIRNFAQNHYSRTYVLDQSSTLFSQLDRFDILNEAWTGLENQVEGTPNYNTGYKINPKFRWLAPFWNEEANKLRAWATIPHTNALGGTQAPLWGLDGKGVPTQFEEWNEEVSRIYVPIEVEKWNRASSKFDSDFVLEAEKEPRGMLIRFPNIMWETFKRSSFLLNFPSLNYLDAQFSADSVDDLSIGPADEGVTYSFFSDGINIPVRTFERYGSTKPTAWTAGVGLSTTVRRIRTEVIQRDDLSPWNFEPISIQSSVDQLNSQGIAAADARAVNRSDVTFAEATKVGLPLIAFDEYADENGCVKHGITNLSVLKNASQFWQTRYSAKTHFPQPVKIRPVQEETMEDFRFALHRINERLNRPLPTGPFQPPPIFDPKTDDGKEFISFPRKEAFQTPVIITEIISFINDNGDDDIAYAGEDARGLTWPASRRLSLIGGLNPNSKIGRNPNAVAVDGFLQRGMQATYFYEDLGNGEFNHYFRGGISLTVARIVTALGSPKIVEAVARMDVEIPSNVLTVPVFDSNRTQEVVTEKIILLNVPFSDQQNVDLTLTTGSKVLIGGHGIENGTVLKPTLNNNLEYEVDVSVGNNKDQTFILTGGRAGAGAVFASITVRPNDVTGRGATIQTLSSIAGTTFEDGKLIGASEGVAGTRFFVDFVGIEFSQVTLGDTAMVTQEAETNDDPTEPTVIRLLTYIPKPLFMSTDALGGSVG